MSDRILRQFADLVAKWSPRINLVSKGDLGQIWERHIQDSLALVPYIPPGVSHATDLGSGAGFPGVVLAIATGIEFTLIESDTRKAAFLREAARLTGAPVKIHNTRIEAAKTVPARLVTARALAPLDKLLGLALPHLAPDGICLFPKGPGVEVELTAAKALWHMDVACHALPGGQKNILKVSRIRHVGNSDSPPQDHRHRQPEGGRG